MFFSSKEWCLLKETMQRKIPWTKTRTNKQTNLPTCSTAVSLQLILSPQRRHSFFCFCLTALSVTGCWAAPGGTLAAYFWCQLSQDQKLDGQLVCDVERSICPAPVTAQRTKNATLNAGCTFSTKEARDWTNSSASGQVMTTPLRAPSSSIFHHIFYRDQWRLNKIFSERAFQWSHEKLKLNFFGSEPARTLSTWISPHSK